MSSIDFEGAYADSVLVRYGAAASIKQVNLQMDATAQGQMRFSIWCCQAIRPISHGRIAWQHCWTFWLARPELVGSAVKPIVVSADKMLTREAVLACYYPPLYYLGSVADRASSFTVCCGSRDVYMSGSVCLYFVVCFAMLFSPSTIHAQSIINDA